MRCPPPLTEIQYPVMVFESCKFEKPHLVSFRDTDLSRMLFLRTDIDKISLWSTKFEERSLKVHGLLMDPEVRIEYMFDDVIETYARLRKNFEESRRYSEVEKLFIGEMEAKRTRRYYEFLRSPEVMYAERPVNRALITLKKLYLWLRVNVFSPYALYKYFSDYGESYVKPFLWSIGVIFTMPALYALLVGKPTINGYFENLPKSAGLFFQLLPTDYPPATTLTTLQILERLLGVVLVGLEVIALKRKLERR